MPTNPPAAERPPSRLFTDYYASVFMFLIAAFVGASFFVLRPLLTHIKETNAQTESQLQLITRERNYLASLDQSVAAAQSIPPTSLDQVSRALPNDPNIPSLLVQFGSAAQRNSVRIGSLNFSQPPAPTGAAKPAAGQSTVMPLDISLTLQARSYFDVKRFLTDVEASLRLIDVLGITASASGNDLNYSLQLRTYAFSASTSTKL